jgi:hydrogenase maturation protease
MGSRPKRLLVLGLGNDILGDDAIGLVVADLAFERLRRSLNDVEVHHVSAQIGGWRLLDLLPGYDEIIIIDAMQSGGAIGECYRVGASEQGTLHLRSSHGLSLSEAIALAFPSSEEPPMITVYGVEAKEVRDLGEGLSPELEQRTDDIVAEITSDIECGRAARRCSLQAA